MKPSGTLAILWRRYIQEIFALIEIVIIFLIIAFLLASTIPGLLLTRKRQQTPRIVILPRSSNRPATV
jgi:competence protein ComGC